MNNKTASGSHEGHGAATVHLCPKCRWPFPNPHPSAKHRRAHKKVCGTIQGYELDTDMDPSLSDDDHSQTPRPKPVEEKGECVKPSGGIGERSNRSEDEVYSDAVTEFSDSGFTPGVIERPKDFKVVATGDKDLMVFHAFKDNAADLIELSSNSTVSSQIENPEVHENATTLPGGNLVSQVHVSSTTEESAGEDVSEGLMTYVGQETDAKGSSEINPDGNVAPLLASEYPGLASEAESRCQETEKMTTDPVPATEVVLSKEEHGAEMVSKMCSMDPMPGVESLKPSDAADTAQNRAGAEQGLDFAGSVNSNEGFSGKKEGNENVYELSVPSIPVVDHAETKLENFKDHKGVKLDQPVTLDSENVYELSVPADIPVVDHAGTMLEGFKDKKVDVEDHLSEVNCKVSALDVPAVEDNLIHKDSMPVVEKDVKERVNEEYFAENITATDPPEFQGNSATKLDGSDDGGDRGKGRTTNDGVGVESKEESSEGKLLQESKTSSESDNNLHGAHVAKDVRDASVMELSETKFINVNVVSDTLDVPKQLQVNGNDKAQGECDAKHGRDIDSVERKSLNHETKASLDSPLETESYMQGSVSVGDNYDVEQGMGHSGINQPSRRENDDNNFVKHQFGASGIDVSVDSLSQTDSLEGNWGSISVLSTQSDIPAVVDAENLSTDSLAAAEADKLNSEKPEGLTERQHSEKSDVFEAPSFMTLVEPGRSGEKAAAPDMQTVQNLQQQNPSQAGWFPSLTNVVNDSQGRKKNEERIAKVTNWSTGKQHTPLKNLLGEANLETKPKSPNPKENKAHVIQKHETGTKDGGAVPVTVSAILGPEAPAAEPAKRGTEKEVNSPTRYPTDIKREKRKDKGRPYWAQFVCCSSVN